MTDETRSRFDRVGDAGWFVHLVESERLTVAHVLTPDRSAGFETAAQSDHFDRIVNRELDIIGAPD